MSYLLNVPPYKHGHTLGIKHINMGFGETTNLQTLFFFLVLKRPFVLLSTLPYIPLNHQCVANGVFSLWIFSLLERFET